MLRRYQVFHAYLGQVPTGTAASELPNLSGGPHWCAVSRLAIDVPAGTNERVAMMAARGMLFDAGLASWGALSFIREVSLDEQDITAVLLNA